MTVKPGSLWWSGTEYFRVLSRAEVNGEVWIHYRKEASGAQEYSCYEQSFLQRFRPYENAKH